MSLMLKTIITYILLFALFPTFAFAMTVVVDAGHGGWDPGAVSAKGLQEKAVTLDIAQRLQTNLTQKGIHVIMTRSTDQYVSLPERVQIANQAEADLFVSIHANEYRRSSVAGSLILYYDRLNPSSAYPASLEMGALTPASRILADSVLTHLTSQVGSVNRGLVPSSAYVVRMGKTPSILVETGFLSNPGEAGLLATAQYREQDAQGIASGIVAYDPVIFPDLLDHWSRPYVLDLKNNGIVTGIDRLYYPEQSITRAEFLTMLNRMAPAAFDSANPSMHKLNTTVTSATYSTNSDSAGAAEPAIRFADLAPNHWAYASVENAALLGYVQGYPDGTARPDQPISRAEAAVLFNRIIYHADNTAVNLSFHDVTSSSWAVPAIAGLSAAGVITGISSDYYAPSQLMKRSEAAAMLDRYMKRSMLLVKAN